MDILLSFVGNRDPYVENTSDFGPVLSLLEHRGFARIVLFCTGSDYVERAKTVEKIACEELGHCSFTFINLELESVVDYEEIYARLEELIDTAVSRSFAENLSVLLDPGTPQMQTCWFLLVRSGRLAATLLQGVPPRFAGGSYRVKEVRIDGGVLPSVFAARSGPASSAYETVLAPCSEPHSMMDAVRSRREGLLFDAAAAPDEDWIGPSAAAAIVGASRCFEETLLMAHRASPYDISVLVQGETGCGKGVVAKFIHDAGRRRRRPFLPVNCASITEAMAESELFGHAKGSFTGASTDRLGKFRAADGGTIFLDEVGDLPPAIQPKLLRVLEDKTCTPLGSDRQISVDVRVIAATNRNLQELIAEGWFRRDLYERLAQMIIVVPSLRDRPEDIGLLADLFLRKWNERYHERKGLSEETMKLFLDYPWPGNVRELENAVSSLCAAGRSGSIGPALLPPTILAYFKKDRALGQIDVSIPEEGLDLKAILSGIERSFYIKALERSGGNRAAAAALLGLNPPAFRKAARERFGLDSEGRVE